MAALPTHFDGTVFPPNSLVSNKIPLPTPSSSHLPNKSLTLPLLGPVKIAVIGGTGLQALEGFTPVATLNISTPWGVPSSPITILSHNNVPVAFLSRHGLFHEYAPHEVPNRANIAALRSIGVRCIIAFSAVGSLQEEIKPRDFVVPNQVIDRTKGIRPFTFFEGGAVGHVGFADPFDEGVAEVVRKCGHALAGEGVTMHDKGTIICMGMFSFSFLYLTISPFSSSLNPSELNHT